MIQSRISQLKICLFLFLAIGSSYGLSAWSKDDLIALSKKGSDQRCSNAIDGQQCVDVNKHAFDNRAITRDGFDWLNGEKRDDGNSKWYVTTAAPGIPGSMCVCGCFHPDAAILVSTSEGTEEKKARDISKQDTLVVLEGGSALSSPQLVNREISNITKGSETKPLLVFELSSSRVLKVTDEHGMVLADGTMLKAKEVKVGMKFIEYTGKEVEVFKISEEVLSSSEEVVNFRNISPLKMEHLMIAEGVFVGDLSFQNEWSDLKAIQLRQ